MHLVELSLNVSELRDRLKSLLDEASGEITAEVEDVEEKLDCATLDLESKADAYAWIREELRSEAAALKVLEDRFRGRRQAREAAIRRLEDRLLHGLNVAGVEKMKTQTHSVTVATTYAVALSVDPEKLPKLYRRIKVEADKAAIKKALQENKKVRGAALVANRGVRIR